MSRNERTAAPSSTGEDAGAPIAQPRHRETARVLIVEDQALIALSLAADLAALDCEVVGRAASGESAIEMAPRCLPDLVIMDVHLVGAMDGIEAAARIQAECGARIVFVTAFAEGPDRPRMAALRPIAILGKPYDSDELSVVVLRASAGRDRTRLAAAAG